MPQSLADLKACADRHLHEYTDPRGSYAFNAYDVQGDPSQLETVDCFAPSLLGASVSGSPVIAMCTPGTAAESLLMAMRRILTEPRCATADFIRDDLDSPALQIVADAIKITKDVPGVKAVKVSKILHRKRPSLIPIIDRLVFGFHTGLVLPGGPYDASVRRFWEALQRDLRKNQGWLAEFAEPYRTPDGRPLSVLRAADIIVWHHAYTGCTDGRS